MTFKTLFAGNSKLIIPVSLKCFDGYSRAGKGLMTGPAAFVVTNSSFVCSVFLFFNPVYFSIRHPVVQVNEEIFGAEVNFVPDV